MFRTKYDVVHLTIGNKSGYAVRRNQLFGLITSYKSVRSRNIYWSDPEYVKDYCLHGSKEAALENRLDADESIIVREDPTIVKIIDGNN